LSRPLSTLGLDERRLYADLGADPQAPELPYLLADAAEDQGLASRVTLLRQHPRTALVELLRGRALDEDDCKAILRETGNTARHIMWRLLRPNPQAPLPGVLTEAGLSKQFAFAQTLLAAYGLPTGSVRADDLRRRIQTDKTLREQIEAGRSLLLLIPRIPLSQVTPALASGLRANEDFLRLASGVSLSAEPVVSDLPPELFYLDSKHGAADPNRWLSEADWMAQKDTDVLFIEPSPDVPASARNRSAADTWRDRHPGEALLTPHGWAILLLALQHLRGQTVDVRTFSLLAGAATALDQHDRPRHVPDAYWGPGRRRAALGGRDPGHADPGIGARAASEGN
jgi:hypothetical protein